MLIEKDKLYVNTLLVLFWIRALIDFIAEEFGLSGISSIVNLLYDAGIVFIGIISLKHRGDIIFLLVTLLVGYWITCVHNGCSLLFYVNGLREFLYLLFVLPILRYIYISSNRYSLFSRKFDKTLYIFLWVQVFCMTWQFIKYGANDHGGGSLGYGNSGVISTLIYFISFYLMKRRFAKNSDNTTYIQNLINNKDLIFLLLPSFLNETKISFIFFAFYFVLLVPVDKKFIKRLIFIIPLMAIVLPGVMWLYLTATGNTDDITSLEYYAEYYLYADEESDIMKYGEFLYETGDDELEDIPRITKIIMIPELNAEYPGHDITGYGIGHFKGGSIIDNSKFYYDNEWLLVGSIPYLYHMYIQMGLIGFALLAWFFFRLSRLMSRGIQTEKGIIIYLLIAFVLIIFYNDSFRITFVDVILLYLLTQSLTGNLTKQSSVKTT